MWGARSADSMVVDWDASRVAAKGYWRVDRSVVATDTCWADSRALTRGESLVAATDCWTEPRRAVARADLLAALRAGVMVCCWADLWESLTAARWVDWKAQLMAERTDKHLAGSLALRMARRWAAWRAARLVPKRAANWESSLVASTEHLWAPRPAVQTAAKKESSMVDLLKIRSFRIVKNWTIINFLRRRSIPVGSIEGCPDGCPVGKELVGQTVG